jgi:hypothetical protein
MGRTLAIVTIAGCGFTPGTTGDDTGDDQPNGPDAMVACIAGEPACSGHQIGTCNASGDGIVDGSAIDCPLTCVDAPAPHCAAASNLDPASQVACVDGAELAPASGAVTITDNGPAGALQIECAGGCGTTITIESRGRVVQSGTDVPALSWFCLSRIALGNGLRIDIEPDVVDAVAIFVDGAVDIDGEIEVGGESSAATVQTGQAVRGGPGGGRGGPKQGAGMAGNPGSGPCFGFGGGRSSGNGGKGAGGGGGGNVGHGGVGGDSNGSDIIGLGGLGGLACVDDDLVPLTGGSGGGSGGDGYCTGSIDCGWAGGGGGGAIQIAARDRIAVTGAIFARGGNGYGEPTGDADDGGGGGGGAGGGILLESRTIAISGALDVRGGNGGVAAAGPGGAGALDVVDGTDGTDATSTNLAGAGGGGASGRIRLNAIAAVCGAFATPLAACIAGELRAP